MTAPATGPFEAFTRDFFETLGQTVHARAGRLEVSLAGELRDHYGCEALTLTFSPHDSEGEYVAFGSRAFEAMLAFLASRGRLAQRRLPPGPAPTPVRLVNGTARPLEERGGDRHYQVFNFQLAFVSDERSERLLGVCLDEAGEPAPEALAWLEAAGGGEACEAALAPEPAVERAAEAWAIAEAERLAWPIEGAIHERLQRLAGRLVAYYDAQIAEVVPRRRRGQSDEECAAAAEEEQRRLRRDLERKLGEETSRHQLRVQLRLISRVSFGVPGAWRVVELASLHTRRAITYWENRHLGTSELPPCERCGTLGPMLALCAVGHLTCPGCQGACANCSQDCCSAELSACFECGRASCPGCLLPCTSGHAVCSSHLASCRCCGQAFCGACSAPCADCAVGGRVAMAHGRPCAVCDRALCAPHQLGCAWCGAAVCVADRMRCAGCGETVCRTHLGDCGQCDLPYCARCRDEGADCRACAAVGGSLPAPGGWLASLAGLPLATGYGDWRAIENEDYRYLLGRGVAGDLLVVLGADGAIVRVKDIGVWRQPFDRPGRG